jgi:hypothetical protein
VRPLSRLIAMFVASLIPLVAAAQPATPAGCVYTLPDEGWTQDTARRQLGRLDVTDCLGGAKDAEPVAVSSRALTAKALTADAPIAERRAAVSTALTLLAGYVRAQTSTAALAPLAVVGDRLAQASLSLGTTSALVMPATWVVDQGGLGSVDAALPLPAALLDASCRTRTPVCETTFAGVAAVFRAVKLANLALARAESDTIRAFVAETARRKRSWDDYFDVAHSQYWWELQLNARRLVDDRNELEGVKQGFRSPPTNQLILLHPSTALEWARREPNGSSYGAIVNVELLGGNWWRYDGDGSLGRSFGIAAIVTARDRVNMRDFAWGASVMLNQRYTFGLTTDGKHYAVMLTTDVAKLWNRVGASRREAMALLK